MKENCDNSPAAITLTRLRENTRRILDQAAYFGKRWVVLRNGEQVVVILGVDDYRNLVGAPGAPAIPPEEDRAPL